LQEKVKSRMETKSKSQQRILLPLSLVFLLLLGHVLSGESPGKKPGPTKAELGKLLFFDPILSADSSVSCGSCHKPEFYFADTTAFSKGVGGKLTKRNTPSVLNMASRDALFWDGRAKSLEHQVLFPIRDPNEMNLPIPKAIEKLRRNRKYRGLFVKIFKRLPDEKSLSDAIAAYESTLETSESPFDRTMKGKAPQSPDELAGQKLFVGKAKCFDCHFGPDFTGDEFKNVGLFNGKNWNDAGRFGVTGDSSDLGKFKVPGLRNVARTAPYMHNGKFKTLRAVIDYYQDPSVVVENPIGLDSSLNGGIRLSEKEKQQLEAFLNSLTSPL
jgi:cytochrome c peroxidase